MKTKELKGILKDMDVNILDGYTTSTYGSIKLKKWDTFVDLMSKLHDHMYELEIENYKTKIKSDNITLIIIIWQK